jgi:hypothetical protein
MKGMARSWMDKTKKVFHANFFLFHAYVTCITHHTPHGKCPKKTYYVISDWTPLSHKLGTPVTLSAEKIAKVKQGHDQKPKTRCHMEPKVL